MRNLEKLKNLLAISESDIAEIYKRYNSAAGIRLRKTIPAIKATASDLRKEVGENKKD